jgi:RNA polymerase sigma factor (sigma-70 family)
VALPEKPSGDCVVFAGPPAYVERRLNPLDTVSSELEAAVGRFAALVRRVGLKHRLPEADLEDVLQEVRIRLWRGRSRPQSEQIERVSASYVYRVAVSATVDLLRRRRARGADQTVALDETEELVADHSDPARSVEESELSAQLVRAIEAITPSRRPVLRMYLAGYSREEVAKVMGWSEAKTRNLLYRGLADLRERLKEMGITWETRA